MADPSSQVAALIARYAALVRSAVAKVAGRADRDLGDEVLQRVSESLLRQVRAQREIAHPASYLYRCAVRETVRETLRRLDQEGADASPELPGAAAAQGQPEDELRGRQLEARVRALLDALPPERAAAARAQLAGFSVEEVMAMHGWSYQKARNLIARGVADLRKGLAGEER